METIFSTICAAVMAGSINVADQTIIACVNNDPPKIAADGARFTNRGTVGQQVNFIVANANAFGLTLAEQE